MTNQEAVNLLAESRRLLNGIPGFPLNKAIVEAEMELEIIKTTLEKMIKVPDDVKKKAEEYQKELDNINNKYCKKKNGKPDLLEETLPTGKPVFKFQFEEKELEKRNKAIDELSSKFKSTSDKLLELEKKRIELLSEDSGYKKHSISSSIIPEDVNTEQTRVLYRLFIVNK